MQRARYSWFWVLILVFLSFSSATAQNENPQKLSGPDSTGLEALVRGYFTSFAAKDLEGALKFWSAKSPNLERIREQSQQLFAANERIELKGLQFRRTTVDGEKATLQVETEMDADEASTGKAAAGFGKKLRSLECIKEEGAWKIWNESSAIEALAVALVACKTEDDRKALLAGENELATVELVRALSVQARQLVTNGAYAQSLDILLFGKAIAEKIGDRDGVSGMQAGEGIVYSSTGDLTKAAMVFRESLAIAESIGNRGGIVRALNGLGLVFYSQGDYLQAIEHHQKCLAIVKEMANQLMMLTVLNNLGISYQRLDKFAQSLDAHQQSLALARQMGDKLSISRSLGNIGNVLESQGNYDRALKYHEESLAYVEEVGDQEAVVITLNNMGIVCDFQGKADQAKGYFQRGLQIAERIGFMYGIGSLQRNLGRNARFRGNLPEAMEHLRKGLAIHQESGEKEGISEALVEIAEIYKLQGDPIQSLEYSERGAELAVKIGVPSLIWRGRTTMGLAHQTLNHPAEAAKAFQEAISEIEAGRERVAGGEQDQQIFLEDKLAPYYSMIELHTAQNHPYEAFIFAERAKARTLLDVLLHGRVNIAKTMTAIEQEEEKAIKQQIATLNKQLIHENQQTAPDAARLNDLKGKLQQTRRRFEEFQTNLYAARPELKAQRGEAESLSLEQARNLLPDTRSALLEYIVTEQKTYLFVLTAKGAETKALLNVYPLGLSRKDLGDRIARFRETLAQGSPGFRPASRELYDLLLKPAAGDLKGKSSLVIAPDGALWDLPFQALASAQSRYLIQDYAVAYAPSLTALREMNKIRDHKLEGKTPTLIAFGNPSLGRRSRAAADSGLMDESFAPLPQAERQVNGIRQIYGTTGSRVYIGAAAREERAKTEAGGYRILHLAAHGVLNDKNPMYSYILMAQTEGETKEDGLLEAWEILNMDLKADLTVLSACETARGRVGAGEGMIGLSWALFVAGCPTAIVSQWKVDSAGTTELMLEFHRQLKAQMNRSNHAPLSAAHALRAASLKLQRTSQYRHPFYWAGFIAAGKGF